MTLRFGVHSSGKMASRNLEGIIIAPTGYKFRLHPEGHKIRQAAQLSFIWLLGLLLAANVSPVAAAGSLQAEVLTLRHRPDSQKINASPSIDPFNWSKKQTAEFRERVPLVKSSAAAGLTLNAIIWGPQQALAVINGRITEKGNRVTLADDQHRQATILTIMADKVIFDLEGNHHTLWLDPVFGLPSTTEMLPPTRGSIGNQSKGTDHR